VPTALLAALLLVVFGALDALGDRLTPRARRIPLVAYGLVLAALGMEWARWDHGRPEWLLWIGWVAAPVVVIFGASLAGARRWYGWPDLGPVPGRLAGVAGALVLGVLLGSRAKASDVESTKARGEAIAHDVRAWRDAHGGRWPSDLAEAVASPPATAMGVVAPPPFRYEREDGRPDAAPRLAFPVRTGTDLVRDLGSPEPTWKAR
jgi:hypothetical protein